MPSFGFGDATVTVTGNVTVAGSTTISTKPYSTSEKAIMDILPKIKETHPDLFLKYLDLIPEGNKR